MDYSECPECGQRVNSDGESMKDCGPGAFGIGDGRADLCETCRGCFTCNGGC